MQVTDLAVVRDANGRASTPHLLTQDLRGGAWPSVCEPTLQVMLLLGV